MRPGVYWYAMQDPAGAPQGYARLLVVAEGDDGTRYDWRLRIAFPGGTYEEERSLTLDAAGRMVAASFEGTGAAVQARRQGDRLVGTARSADGKEEPVDLRVEDDALSGMGFVRAADLPRESGRALSFADYDESAGFRAAGRAEIRVGEREPAPLPGGEVEAWRIVLTRADGNELPLWVDDAGVLVQADWGGGNLMVLHDEPTEHLFEPAPPMLRTVEPELREQLVLEGEIAGASPRELFTWWTRADRLERWWPHEAEVGEAEGEPFRLRWEEPAWFLDGVITRYEPGRLLAFTWTWEHLPDAAPLEVEVDFEDAPGGTRLRITQGPYRDSDDDRKERAGHRRGWEVVCTRLADAVAQGA
jgi:uncharacterized protein YndB with AHSA1/START domain